MCGKNVGSAASKAATINGVKKVLVMDDASLENNLPEVVSSAVSDVVKNYSHILAPSSNFGKNFLPRTAALLDSSPLTDVVSVIDENTFKRPLYAGNAIATMKMSDAIKFLLVRPTAFDKAGFGSSAAPVESVSVGGTASRASSFVSQTQTKSARPELSTARVVVSGGRGMKSGENFAMLETMADKLGGAVGASRAAVDAGFVPNDYQVGQTGKVVAPDLYIAVCFKSCFLFCFNTSS